MQDIITYSDFRVLLKDLFVQRKKENPRYSYRVLARKAGFKSAGYFGNLLSGKCNPSLTMAYRLAEAFDLKRYEEDFFVTLVQFNLAATASEKVKYYEKLNYLSRTELKILEAEQYGYFGAWYNIAIREILDYYKFKGNYAELANMVVPAISPVEAKQAIANLESVGMIRKNPFGHYEKIDSAVTTPPLWNSAGIANYQNQCLDLAKQSFDSWERKFRDVSTLTVSIAVDEFQKIQEKINQVQEDILLIAQNVDKADRVYQINFYSFPLTRIGEKL